MNPDIEKEYTIIANLSEIYPQMYLSEPLTYESEDTLLKMNSCEREFTLLLLDRGLLLFREPEIEGMDFLPDFFVYNVEAARGKLVELTLFNEDYSNGNSSKKSIERKKRQIENLERTGIPYTVLKREQLSMIREYCCPELF
jgi:hypothetical protein